jgi:phosphohistidine phosphatase
MDLILLRHGKAEDGHPRGDFARELTEKGRQQAERAADLLKRLDRLPEVVLTSPRVRARQTAEAFCRAAGCAAPVVEPWIDCGMRPESALGELVGYTGFERVMMVGHEPDFSALAEWVLGARGSVEVKKGSLIGLEIRPPAASGRLAFSLPPKMIAAALGCD